MTGITLATKAGSEMKTFYVFYTDSRTGYYSGIRHSDGDFRVLFIASIPSLTLYLEYTVNISSIVNSTITGVFTAFYSYVSELFHLI